MTPPPGPSPRPSLSPERLAELLDDAVQHVTAPGDALDRIRRGVRRHRTARRAGAVVLAVAVLAGGGSTALAVTSGHGPSGLASGASSSTASPSFASSSYSAASGAAGAGAQRPTTGVTLVSAPAATAVPPGAALAPAPSAVPSAAASGNSQAKAAYPSLGQRSLGLPTSWDTATIVPVGNAKTTSSFRLVVHLTRLGTQSVPFTATSMTGMPPNGPVIVGAADAARDGHAQLFVLVDAGCCTEFWTIFRLVDGRVRQMTMSGQPVRLAVGGTVMNNGGFSCAGPGLVTYAYQPGTTAGTFLATRDTYRWAGATLVLASHQQTTIRGTPQDQDLARYRGVDCGGLPQYELIR